MFVSSSISNLYVNSNGVSVHCLLYFMRSHVYCGWKFIPLECLTEQCKVWFV